MILQIIEEHPIGSQEDLADALEGVAISTTQATLSRDLRELGVARVHVGDGYRYMARDAAVSEAAAIGPNRMRVIVALEVTDVDANDQIVAVRTIPGRAEGVAAYLDELQMPEVLATIAGDDTLIVYPRHTRSTARLRRRLAEMFGTH
jgi:transcriptional regulator of arginine metabolism